MPRRSTAANGTVDESALRPARRGNSVRKLKEQLAESIEQQQATSAILRNIASSRTDAQLVFDMIAASAARLCDAQLSHVFRFGGNLLYFAASNGLSSEGLEVVRGAWPRRPDRGSAAGRAILSGAIEQIVLKKSALLAESQHWVGRARLPSSGRRLRDWDQLGELAEVLGGGGEEELVLGTIRAPQAQAVELQDTLEVGEQHLDLLPLAA